MTTTTITQTAQTILNNQSQTTNTYTLTLTTSHDIMGREIITAYSGDPATQYGSYTIRVYQIWETSKGLVLVTLSADDYAIIAAEAYDNEQQIAEAIAHDANQQYLEDLN